MSTGNYDATCSCIRTVVQGNPILAVNGAPNASYLAPQAIPGVMGGMLFYTGKATFSFNLALTKEIRISERARFGIYAEAANFLNHPFFGYGTISATSTRFGDISSASGARSMQLRAYLDF